MAGVRKPEKRELARALRREGLSMREIAERVACSVSSVSLWVRDIELTEEQRKALLSGNPSGTRGAAACAAWSRQNRERRLEAQEHGRQLARRGDPLHAAGCMLYWGEGAKRRNDVVLTNSDAALLRYFVEFLRRCYAVQDADISLSVNCFDDNGVSVEEIEQWWLKALDLPARCLRRATVNRPSRSSAGARRPLIYGTARVSVHSTFIVQSIYGAIQEYAGFERPEWLDLEGARRPLAA